MKVQSRTVVSSTAFETVSVPAIIVANLCVIGILIALTYFL